MSWLKDAVEGVFHWSNITYISNAYPADVWVAFNNRQLEIDKVKLEAVVSAIAAGNRGNLGMELKKVASASWVKVAYGSTHKKDRNAKTEYVTVVASPTLDQATAARDETSAKVLVFDYEVKQNKSFIVTRNGEFQEQKYGSSNLFLDWGDEDHTPEDL